MSAPGRKQTLHSRKLPCRNPRNQQLSQEPVHILRPGVVGHVSNVDRVELSAVCGVSPGWLANL